VARIAAIALVTALLFGLAACAPGAAAEPELWESVSLAQARELIEEAGGRIGEVRDRPDGEYVIEAVLPDGLPLKWEGLTCKGEARACTEFAMVVALPAGSEARAKQIALERDVYYVADGFEGADYLVWRMSFTYGGVTRAHVRQQLIETLNSARIARKEIATEGK
jgi:hypothetical protein